MGGKAGNICQQVQLFHLSDSFPYSELLCKSGTSKGYGGPHYILGTMVSTVVTFCLSLACSMVTDHLAVRPLERLAERIRFEKDKI